MDEIQYIAKPWKVGNSIVISIPSHYIKNDELDPSKKVIVKIGQRIAKEMEDAVYGIHTCNMAMIGV